MNDRMMIEELRNRIAECARHYGGAITRDAGFVWDGYLAALLEWGLLSPAGHSELSSMLPKVADNPVMGVFLGWEKHSNPVKVPDRDGK